LLQVTGGANQAATFLAAQQHPGSVCGKRTRLHLVQQFAVIERDLEEELQASVIAAMSDTGEIT